MSGLQPSRRTRVLFHGVFRYLEGGLNIGMGLLGVVLPATFLPAMLPVFADSASLSDPAVLLLGRQLAMMFLLTGLLLFFGLKAPSAGRVRVMLACFVPVDLVAMASFVIGAADLGWQAETVFSVAFGAFLLLCRLPYIAKPALALGATAG